MKLSKAGNSSLIYCQVCTRLDSQPHALLKTLVGARRCRAVGARLRLPDAALCPRVGIVERALLAVTASVCAPLLSMRARAVDDK